MADHVTTSVGENKDGFSLTLVGFIYRVLLQQIHFDIPDTILLICPGLERLQFPIKLNSCELNCELWKETRAPEAFPGILLKSSYYLVFHQLVLFSDHQLVILFSITHQCKYEADL